jgi:hypothetical protein
MAFSNPLRWPVGWPRNKAPIWPTFKASFQTTTADLEKVLGDLGCVNPVVTTNHPTRLDGGLRTAAGITPEDPGVALYFTRNGEELCIPCDKFTTVYANLRAIGLTLEYIRRMERYGTSEMVNAAFRGFKALPETIIMGAGQLRAWYEVLQVSQDADDEIVKAAWRRLTARYHPDNSISGDPAKFEEVQRAFKESGAAS